MSLHPPGKSTFDKATLGKAALGKAAGNAFGMLLGGKQQAEEWLRQQIEPLLKRMDLVTREEHLLLKDMLTHAREEQEKLIKRVEELEARLEDRLEEKGF